MPGQDTDPVLFWIGLSAASALGLVFGSFATALSHRIPAGISWSFSSRSAGRSESMPRSRCPHCQRTLAAIDLVPLFSWLFLRGRCRTCKAPIGWAYPAMELSSLCACAGIFMAFGPGVNAFALMPAVPLLVALTAIDLKHFILPDVLNGLLAALGLVLILTGCMPWLGGGIGPALAVGCIGAVLYGAFSWVLGFVMKKMLRKDALGFGDVKFFAVAGLWLGPGALPFFLMLTGILGVIMGIIYRILTKAAYFPFGPALIASFYVLLLTTGLHGALGLLR